MAFYPNIFQEGKLGTKVVKNRIYSAPSGDNMANPDGSVSEQVIAYHEARAKGGAGIIIPGVVCVDYPVGKTVACQLRLDQIKYVSGWNRLADAVHRYGALLLPQLHHAGVSTDALLTEGQPPVALNADIEKHQTQLTGTKPKDEYVEIEKNILTIEAIKALEQKFIDAASYAQMAGCDGIMLHSGAHYLIGNFLHPGTNQRTDEYGGSLENRFRFGYNIIKGIRAKCGKNFIIGVRSMLHEEDCEENEWMAKKYVEAGVDFLDASFLFNLRKASQNMEDNTYPQGARLLWAANLKKHVDIPVFVSGAFKEPEFVDKAIGDGLVDYVGFARQLYCDPEWVNKAKAGKADEIRYCLTCSECADNNRFSRSLKCALNPEFGREYTLRYELAKKVDPKKVVIVGGGIGGMEAAITAKRIGHDATLFEASDKLGGQMHLACVPPNKSFIKKDIAYFTGECERKNVDVKLNTKADIDTIKSLNPDHVILALGSEPFIAPIKGADYAVRAWDLLSEKVAPPEGGSAVIIGGGIIGCEVAEYLQEKDNKVDILEMLPELAPDMFWMARVEMLDRFKENSIGMHTNACIKEIKDEHTVVYELDGKEVTVTADIIIMATGQRSVKSDLPTQLDNAGIPYTCIGDGKKARRFINATSEGFFAVLNM